MESNDASSNNPLSEEQTELLEQSRVQVLSIIGTLGGLLDEDEDEEEESNPLSTDELIPLREAILALYTEHAADASHMSHRLINKPLTAPSALPLLTAAHGLDEYQRAQLWYVLHSAGAYMADIIGAQVPSDPGADSNCALCARLGALCLKYRTRLHAVSAMHKQALAERRADAEQHAHALRVSRAEGVVAEARSRDATAEKAALAARLTASEAALEEARAGRDRAERAAAAAEEEARDWRARTGRAEEEAEAGRREAERLMARIQLLEAAPARARAPEQEPEAPLEPGAMRVPDFLTWVREQQQHGGGHVDTPAAAVPAAAAEMLDQGTAQLIEALQDRTAAPASPVPSVALSVVEAEFARLRGDFAERLRAVSQQLARVQDEAATSARQGQSAAVESAAARRLLSAEQTRARETDRRCKEAEGKLSTAMSVCERERSRFKALQAAALEQKHRLEATTQELAAYKLEVSQWMTAMQSPAIMLRKEQSEKERTNNRQLMDKMLKGQAGKKALPHTGAAAAAQSSDQIKSI